MPFLGDGFATLITLDVAPTILFKEISVQAPGMEGGGAVPRTTMRNLRVRTKTPKSLYEMTDMQLSVEYDPAVIDDIKAAIQVNGHIVVEFPDETFMAVWGWLESFKPSSNQEGERATADVVIMISNMTDVGNPETEVQPTHSVTRPTTTTTTTTTAAP